MAHSAGATYVRIQVPWGSIAPSTRPTGFVATDPTSPGYSWAWLDATVQAADSASVTPILDVIGTPTLGVCEAAEDGHGRHSEGGRAR